MKTSLILSIFVILFSSFTAKADARGFGLGIILGNPTGLSAKGWISKVNAIDAAAAWNLGGNNDFTIHGDYLWTNFSVFRIDKAPIDFYYGIGGRLLNQKHKDKTRIGARVPVGLAHLFSRPSIEVFGELAVILDVIPSTEADFSFGIGARFFF